MLKIQTNAIPNQTFKTVVDNQNCTITLRTLGGKLYFSLKINDTQIISNQICQNQTKLVPFAYLGLLGHFFFVDEKGSSDPTYDGLNTRYFLMFVSENEIV